MIDTIIVCHFSIDIFKASKYIKLYSLFCVSMLLLIFSFLCTPKIKCVVWCHFYCQNMKRVLVQFSFSDNQIVDTSKEVVRGVLFPKMWKKSHKRLVIPKLSNIIYFWRIWKTTSLESFQPYLQYFLRKTYWSIRNKKI